MSKAQLVSGVIFGALATITLAELVPTGSAQTVNAPCHLSYPNIAGKVLLENDKVVVQGFTFPPGVWEGVHAHPANQIYIHLTDAHWQVRFGDRIDTCFSQAGSVGFYGPVGTEQNHESVNLGPDPVELIRVTIKDDCA